MKFYDRYHNGILLIVGCFFVKVPQSETKIKDQTIGGAAKTSFFYLLKIWMVIIGVALIIGSLILSSC